MAYYGLRRSEVLGLTWKSIDFVNNKMTIQQTVQQHTGGSYIHDTKNESSYRSLPLTNIVIELLQTHKKRQDERKKIMGNCYIDNDFVCTWEDGKPITPNYLTKTFHQIIVKCESLPLIRLHDLRHSAASNLLSLGFNIVQVQEWLGHSSPSTTLNFYSHVDVSSKKDIGNALDKIIKFDMR